MRKLLQQVGGHTPMFQIGQGCLAKPLTHREAQFYQLKPTKLAPFMPHFKGIETSNIILEDLTQYFVQPCILDLKMGTRQHSDQDDETKRLSKIARCQNSTSHSLGVRMCGSQWVNPHSGQVVKTDKYAGRGYDVADFVQALRHFLSDGVGNRHSVMLDLLGQLLQLRSTIAALDSFRFYSCSLLIMYEGGLDSSSPVIVKIIDFAQITYQGFMNDSIVHSGPDRGFIKGVDSLITILQALLIE